MTNFDVLIRPVEIKDAQQINLMRRMPGIAENILAVPSESIGQSHEFITSQTSNDHLFCAEIGVQGEAKIIGMAGLHVKRSFRERHCAAIGIMVHKDFHNKGVGSKLMKTLIDLSDNWLMLKRLELSVFPDNNSAIKLYENCGFVREGIKKYGSVRLGKFEDILLMARYHNLEPQEQRSKH